jgi:hypothetical protein
MKLLERNPDGTWTRRIPTLEEIIADKEAKLLAMYEELKALKGE